MSIQMPTELAQAASHLAFMAQVKASGLTPGRFIQSQVRMRLDKKAPIERDSVPGRVWRAMHTSVRTALVMLAAEDPRDPAELARLPWESFSEGDRAAMAATARMLRGELKDAAALW